MYLSVTMHGLKRNGNVNTKACFYQNIVEFSNLIGKKVFPSFFLSFYNIFCSLHFRNKNIMKSTGNTQKTKR